MVSLKELLKTVLLLVITTSVILLNLVLFQKYLEAKNYAKAARITKETAEYKLRTEALTMETVQMQLQLIELELEDFRRKTNDKNGTASK